MHNAGLKVLQKGTLWTLLVIGQSASAGRLGMDISLERSVSYAQLFNENVMNGVFKKTHTCSK